MDTRRQEVGRGDTAVFGKVRDATLAGMERAGRCHIETAALAALRSTRKQVTGRAWRGSLADLHIADAKRAARVWTELC